MRGIVQGRVGAALLWLALAAPAGAQSALQLVPASSNVVETPISIADAKLGTEIHLRNAGADPAAPLRVHPIPLLVRRGDGKGVPAVWTRTGNAGDPDTLLPGEEATFLLSAFLLEAGVYETYIETDGTPAAAAGRIRIVVTRTADTLPSDFLVDPKPTGQDWGGLSTIAPLWTPSSRSDVVLTLRNTTSKPVEFLPPAVVAFARRSGEADTAVATYAIPSVDAACASPLQAGAACALTLHFSPALLPGTYVIDVGVGGTGGGWSQRTEIVRVRATPLLAFLAIVIGAGAGWYINIWRSSGRRALSGLIETTRLKDRLQRLGADPGDADTARLLAQARDRIDEIEVQLRQGADPASDLTAFAAHLGRLADADAIGRAMAKLSPAGQDTLRLRWMALIGQLGDAGTAGSSLDTLLRSLATDVSAWPGLANRAAAATALAAALAALQRAGGTDMPASVIDLAALRKTGTDALAVFDPDKPTDNVAARDASLVTQLAAARSEAGALVGTAASALAEKARDLVKAGGPLPEEQAARAKKVADDAEALAGAAPGRDAAESRLAAATALWTTYRDILKRRGTPLESLAQATTLGVDATPSPPPAAFPALDAPVGVFLPAQGRSLADLEGDRRRNEVVTNLIILIGTGLSGVVTLWAPDPTWGSVPNVIGAMLAGLAAHVAIGEAVVRR